MSSSVVFGSIFSLAGVGVLVYAIRSLRIARRAKRWPKTTGRIVSAYAEEDLDRDPGSDNYTVHTNKFRVHVEYRYVAAGVERTGTRWSFEDARKLNRQEAEEIAGRFKGREEIDVFYDPYRPDESVLLPGRYKGLYQAVFAGIGFIAIGVVLFLFLGNEG